MFALSVIHAAANNHLGFLSAIGLYACATEQAAVRLGRTHCHRTDTGLMVSKCSSLNSVGYYIPWLYACFISARRLAGSYPFVVDGNGNILILTRHDPH